VTPFLATQTDFDDRKNWVPIFHDRLGFYHFLLNLKISISQVILNISSLDLMTSDFHGPQWTKKASIFLDLGLDFLEWKV
jgi:hypothetical protein